MSPNSCEVDIPLVSIVGGQETEGDVDGEKTVNLPNTDTTFTVTREQAATPAITGVFDLNFQGATINGNYDNRPVVQIQNIIPQH